MFSNITVGLLAGLGFGAWVYSQIMKQSGGNTQNSLIVAAAAALGIFLLVVSLLQFFF